jgi:Ca2+-binding RTX toxin-like protein
VAKSGGLYATTAPTDAQCASIGTFIVEVGMVDIPGNISSQAVLDTQDANLGTFSGQFETAGDHDFIKISLVNGVAYSFYVAGLPTGSLTVANATIRLLDANGVQKVGANTDIFFTADATGTFFLDVGESQGTTGEYSLIATADLGNFNVAQTNGDDNATSTNAGERMLGRLGADTLTLAATGADAFGQQGNDILKGNASANILDGGLGNDTLIGNSGADFLFGDAGNDDMFGGSQIDTLHGGLGTDNLNGDADNDFLFGEDGKDFLTGGTGLDNFIFRALSDSKRGTLNRDVITDFSNIMAGDTIQLGAIDAKAGVAGDQQFKFIGQQNFHDRKGELHFKFQGGNTIVEGDVNGDGKADLQIELSGQIQLFDFNFIL